MINLVELPVLLAPARRRKVLPADIDGRPERFDPSGYGKALTSNWKGKFFGGHTGQGYPGSTSSPYKADDPKRLVLFDVWAEPSGLIGPEQFVGDFGHLPSARVVYRGKLTGKFAEEVRTGNFGVTEGVVCKGGNSGAGIWMAKIKTYVYLERLKRAFGERWEDYWE